MDKQETEKAKRINIDLRFTADEATLIQEYAESEGLKLGPYVRAQLLREARKWAGLGKGGSR